MKSLILMVTTLSLAAARPEMYKEQEDFQYSRSSSDEGSKAGFYGAQRGNMGGNYERAHNMDGLAQHQMSGAVKQVEGEAGNAFNKRTGTVFTSANSGGLYGSGNYDVSNLHGRNFDEGVHSSEGLQSHASLSSQHGYNSHQSASALHSSGYNSHGSGYTGQGSNYGHSLQSGNLQALDSSHDASYGQAQSHSSGYHAASGYHSQSAYDSSNAANQLSSHSGYAVHPQSRLIVATPVRVVGRPGQRVAIPVGVQTYDATHSASTLDHNAIDITDAELLNNANGATSNAKGYESAYSYRKQWEKHDVKPEVIALSVPTENPFPKHSELYDDTQASNQYHASGFDTHSGYASRHHSDSQVKSASATQQQYQYGVGSSHSNLASGSNSDFHTHGAYNSGNSADTMNAVSSIDTKPKSYQSSYAYHKSWERQGDPYVIKPVDGAYVSQASQRLSAASSNHGYSSHHTGSQYHGVQEDCDCDENGHIRVARSYDKNDQQTQQSWENLEDLGQQVQKNDWTGAHYTDGQIANQINWESSEDLGQQVQKNDWTGSQFRTGQVESQHTRGNLEDLGQETQQLTINNNWETPESRSSGFGRGDIGQQASNKWFQDERILENMDLPPGFVLTLWKKYQQNKNSTDLKHEPLPNETHNKHHRIRNVTFQPMEATKVYHVPRATTQTDQEKKTVSTFSIISFSPHDRNQSNREHLYQHTIRLCHKTICPTLSALSKKINTYATTPMSAVKKSTPKDHTVSEDEYFNNEYPSRVDPHKHIEVQENNDKYKVPITFDDNSTDLYDINYELRQKRRKWFQNINKTELQKVNLHRNKWFINISEKSPMKAKHNKIKWYLTTKSYNTKITTDTTPEPKLKKKKTLLWGHVEPRPTTSTLSPLEILFADKLQVETAETPPSITDEPSIIDEEPQYYAMRNKRSAN